MITEGQLQEWEKWREKSFNLDKSSANTEFYLAVDKYGRAEKPEIALINEAFPALIAEVRRLRDENEMLERHDKFMRNKVAWMETWREIMMVKIRPFVDQLEEFYADLVYGESCKSTGIPADDPDLENV